MRLLKFGIFIFLFFAAVYAVAMTFVDENNEFLFNYILPVDFKKLQDDKAIFSKEYSEKNVYSQFNPNHP